ncbi:unnamed protein product, partial [marine sediment metagenome]
GLAGIFSSYAFLLRPINGPSYIFSLNKFYPLGTMAPLGHA